MSKSRSRVALEGMFLVSILLGGQAHAQTSSLLAPPPDKMMVSPGGVDMRSGRYAYSQTDLSIGGEAGLSFTRTLNQQVPGHLNPFGSFSHNFDLMIFERSINISQNLFTHGSGPDSQIEVSFGGLSQTFQSYIDPIYQYELSSRAGYATLTFTGTKGSASIVYTFKSSDGTTAVFRPMGSADCSSFLRCAYVSQLTRADGTILSFEYDGTGTNGRRLRSVSSSRGHALLLEYSGTFVVKACVLNLASVPKPSNNVCPAGVPTATYTYDTAAGSQRLASATDPSGAVWGFLNSASSIGFVNPGASSPWLTNQTWKRVVEAALEQDIVSSQTYADGRSYSYNLLVGPAVPGNIPPLAGGSYTDNQGNITEVLYEYPIRPGSPSPGQICTQTPCSPYTIPDEPEEMNAVFQMTSGPVIVKDALGATTSYNYCDPSALANLPPLEQNRCLVTPAPVSFTDPEGSVTHLTWDYTTRHLVQSRQVAKAGSGLADIIRSASYDCSPANMRFCDKPTSLTDARGYTTNFVYDPAHGGILSEMKPAPSSGAARPLKLTTWTQKYAYIKNTAGALVAAATPVWVIVTETDCQTVAGSSSPVCDAAAPKKVTTYEYGANGTANNLFVRGVVVTADGVSRRTCFTYDDKGNQVSQTSPRAGLSSCP